MRVIDLAWLSDEKSPAASGDLKLLALGLRRFRLNGSNRCPQGAIEHVGAVLSLLCKNAGETEFDRLREQCKETDRAQMREVFDGSREKHRAKGFEQGMACGEKRGKAQGIIEG